MKSGMPRREMSSLLGVLILYAGIDFAAVELAVQTEDNSQFTLPSKQQSSAMASTSTIKCPQLDASSIENETEDDQEFPFFYMRHVDSF